MYENCNIGVQKQHSTSAENVAAVSPVVRLIALNSNNIEPNNNSPLTILKNISESMPKNINTDNNAGYPGG
jgi:hypothetical protein